MRWSSLPFWFATRAYFSSGDGTAACAWTPTSTHADRLALAASKNTTWPLATLASIACGARPVEEQHVRPDRRGARLLRGRAPRPRRRGRSSPARRSRCGSKTYSVPPVALPALLDWSTVQTSCEARLGWSRPPLPAAIEAIVASPRIARARNRKRVMARHRRAADPAETLSSALGPARAVGPHRRGEALELLLAGERPLERAVRARRTASVASTESGRARLVRRLATLTVVPYQSPQRLTAGP